MRIGVAKGSSKIERGVPAVERQVAAEPRRRIDERIMKSYVRRTARREPIGPYSQAIVAGGPDVGLSGQIATRSRHRDDGPGGVS